MAPDIALRLAPWLFASEASRREPEPLSGALGCLPSDLLGHVVASLLRLPLGTQVYYDTHVNAKRGAEAVKAFALTCKAARGCIGRAQVAEVIAREGCVPLVRPMDVHRSHPYRDLALVQARSRIVFNVALRAMRSLLMHWANSPGSRGARNYFNELMRSSAPGPEVKTVGRAAMGDSTHVRVSLVANKETFLLCTTPSGVVMHHSDRVVCTGPGPNETFVPGMEVATAFSVPAPRQCKTYWAAWDAELKRLTVCSCDLAIQKYNYGSSLREAWGDNRCAELLDYRMVTWDVERNCVVDERVVESARRHWPWPLGFLLKVWACAGTVRMAFVAADIGGQGCEFEVAMVEYEPGKEGSTRFCTVTKRPGRLVSLSVSEGSGDVAMLARHDHDEWNRSAWRVLHYDVRSKCLRVVDRNVNLCLWGRDREAVLLSPSGAEMVVLIFGQNRPQISVYRRLQFSDGQPYFGMNKTTPPQDLDIDHMPVDPMAISAATFSPCGSRAFFFFAARNPHQGGEGVLVVDVAKTEHSHRVEAEWHEVPHESAPSQAAWSEDGLFVASQSGGGVLRVGLAA
jgi:hypothetical protein